VRRSPHVADADGSYEDLLDEGELDALEERRMTLLRPPLAACQHRQTIVHPMYSPHSRRVAVLTAEDARSCRRRRVLYIWGRATHREKISSERTKLRSITLLYLMAMSKVYQHGDTPDLRATGNATCGVSHVPLRPYLPKIFSAASESECYDLQLCKSSGAKVWRAFRRKFRAFPVWTSRHMPAVSKDRRNIL
jgi:hypothetical protein